jgi:hypothetical protein
MSTSPPSTAFEDQPVVQPSVETTRGPSSDVPQPKQILFVTAWALG